MDWIFVNCSREIDDTAFVYKLTFADDSFYFGYKTFLTSRNKETNWSAYNSSSRTVHKMLSSMPLKSKEILKCFKISSDALVFENELITKYLGTFGCINQQHSPVVSVKSEKARRQALSIHRLIDWRNEEYRQNISSKISESVKRLWENPEYRSKCVAAAKSRVRTKTGPMAETAKRKLSVSLSDKWKDPEYIAKQKIKDESRRKGYNSWRENMSDDDKAELYSRMSMAQKGKPKSEEHKAKLRGKRAPWSDERKKAHSIAMKAAKSKKTAVLKPT